MGSRGSTRYGCGVHSYQRSGYIHEWENQYRRMAAKGIYVRNKGVYVRKYQNRMLRVVGYG